MLERLNLKTDARHPTDVAVGLNVRLARRTAGLSQTELGEAIGVSFQQVQKYEKGVNRIAPSRLAGIAETTGRPIAWFYDQGDAPGEAPPADARLVAEVDLGLLRDYATLSPANRALLRQFAAALARKGDDA